MRAPRVSGRARRLPGAHRVASVEDMTDPANLGIRASDADREATAQRLHTAALEGRLDAEELEERLTAAYAAKHCSELERLTADVTPAPASAPAPPAFVRPASTVNGFAIASLILALVWFWWVGSVLAVIFGHLALNQIGGSGGRSAARGSRSPGWWSATSPARVRRGRRQHALSGTVPRPTLSGAHDLHEPVQERQPHRGRGHRLQDPRVPARQARQGRRVRAHEAAPRRRRRRDRPDVPRRREVPRRPHRGAQDAVPLRRRHRRALHGRGVLRADRAPRDVARRAR